MPELDGSSRGGPRGGSKGGQRNGARGAAQPADGATTSAAPPDPALLPTDPDAPVLPPLSAAGEAIAQASTTDCDFLLYPFVQLLVREFEAHADDAVVRDGIAKALGLPGASTLEDRCPTLAEHADLATVAIVDEFMLMLQFCAAHSLTVLQTQQLFLLLRDALDLVALAGCNGGPPLANSMSGSMRAGGATASSGGGATAAGAAATDPMQSSASPVASLQDVVYHFTRKLARLCASNDMTVDEKRMETVTREEERVDPIAQAAYEAKLAKAKKNQVIEPPPKLKVEVQEEKEVYDRKVVSVGPYFGPADMRRIAHYFSINVFQHWAALAVVLTQPRSVDVIRREVAIEDVPAFLEPLTAAVPEADYNASEARADVERDEAAARATHLVDGFNDELTQISALESAERRVIDEHEGVLHAADKEAAMSSTEYTRTMRVLDGALQATVDKNTTAAALLKRIERVEAAAATHKADAMAVSGKGGKQRGASPH